MKKIKILLLSLTFLVTFNVLAAELDVKFTDMKISGSNLVFDIEIKSDVNTTYLASFEAYIDYNTTAFGTAIASGVTVLPIGIITTPAYSIAKNNSGSRLYLTAYNYTPSVSNPAANVLTTYSKALRVTIPIVNSSQLAGIQFACSLMQGQIYYTSATGGAPIVYSATNCINDLLTLPLNPNVSLLISEVGDPSDNASANFIEIYNAGASAVDFDSFYAWYLNANGSSSVQLTGTLAAGGKYVVTNNSTDFGTAYPGKTFNLVSTIVAGGTTTYSLTTYGNYTDGTVIDVFSGVDVAGKHAVRFYGVVTPNTTTTASEWSISPAAMIDMTPGSHRATLHWIGAAGSAWKNLSNWNEGYIPDVAHHVFINNGGEAVPIVVNGDNAFCHDLTIGGSTPGLVIESDEVNGDGSLITYGTVTGMASVQRFLDADRYWYVSQPVTSAVAGVFLHTWMFTYDETAGDWDEFIEPEATPLSVMQGYAVWTSSVNSWSAGSPPVNDTTVAYNGTLNTGTQSKVLTYTASGGSYGNGWNFVGNPYPSAIDWDATGWTKTNLANDAFHVWNGASYNTYVLNGGTGTNGATKDIPAAQGFFVQTSAAGTLGVNNTVRVHSAQSFYKDGEITPNRLSLTISNGTVSDETLILFNEEASAEIDYSFDARKLMAPAAPQAYTMVGENSMAINTFNNMTQTTSVRMGVNAPEAGEYTITASNIESFDASTPIYLEDLQTSQIINLRETGSYTFSADEGTAERFLVHFTAVQGIGDGPVTEVNSIYATNGQVYVNYNGTNGEISIYNILGQEVSRTTAANGLNILSVPQGNALYIVKVISEGNTVTKKVFVN